MDVNFLFRFLRRLEQSLKKKERVLGPSDSSESGDESPRATSPLLQTKTPRVEIRKSNSIGKLQGSSIASNRFGKSGRYKKDMLLQQDQAVKIVRTNDGYSEWRPLKDWNGVISRSSYWGYKILGLEEREGGWHEKKNKNLQTVEIV